MVSLRVTRLTKSQLNNQKKNWLIIDLDVVPSVCLTNYLCSYIIQLLLIFFSVSHNTLEGSCGILKQKSVCSVSRRNWIYSSIYIYIRLYLSTVPDVPCQPGFNNSLDHGDCLRSLTPRDGQAEN